MHSTQVTVTQSQLQSGTNWKQLFFFQAEKVLSVVKTPVNSFGLTSHLTTETDKYYPTDIFTPTDTLDGRCIFLLLQTDLAVVNHTCHLIYTCYYTTRI